MENKNIENVGFVNLGSAKIEAQKIIDGDAVIIIDKRKNKDGKKQVKPMILIDDSKLSTKIANNFINSEIPWNKVVDMDDQSKKLRFLERFKENLYTVKLKGEKVHSIKKYNGHQKVNVDINELRNLNKTEQSTFKSLTESIELKNNRNIGDKGTIIIKGKQAAGRNISNDKGISM